MDFIIIALEILLLAAMIIVLIRLFKPSDVQDKKLNDLSDKFIVVESVLTTKFESLPDKMTQSNSLLIQEKFTTLEKRLSNNNNEMIEKFSILDKNLTASMSDFLKKNSDEISAFKEQLSKSLNENFDKLNSVVEDKLDKISRRVQENLTEGFNKTNETFQNVIERLAKIDEAQKNIESLSTNVVSLQSVLTDKKTRGIFGEVQLNQILFSVFGEKNDKIYQLQHKLKNDTIADAVLFTPEPIGKLVVDSKFPLENYRKMIDRTIPELERLNAEKEFKNNVKKHINDIAEKYIIFGETSESAIMFLPAESIFAELNANHADVIDYSHRKKVWIVSPTTFMAFLSILQITLLNMERKKFADIIQNEIKKLSIEFGRYSDRWGNLSRDIEKVQKDVKEIHTTTQKISSSFDRIASVDLSDDEEIKRNNILLEVNNQ